jgi:class 3 adenylate cyclase
MSMFNMGSVVVIAAAIGLHHMGHRLWGFFLYTLEIMGHAYAVTFYLGWDSGGWIYIIIPMMVAAFLPNLRKRFKFSINILLLTLTGLMIALTASHDPIQPYPPAETRTMLITNFVMFMMICWAFTHSFSLTLHAVEAQLAGFAKAVTDFLDPMLVQKLRDNEDTSAQHRFLTVLFSDLVGSTSLSREMDAKIYGQMIDEYARAMQEIIQQQGGYLEDISGDGILAYVGNFESAGDQQDARAVVDMAVEMQRKLEALNAEFATTYHPPRPLKARIGINSGEALVGKVEGSRAIYTANSEAVNLAAKLEQGMKQIEPNGGILIGAKTAELVGETHEMQPHSLALEGGDVSVFVVNYKR